MTVTVACTLDETAAVLRARTMAAMNAEGLRDVVRSGRTLALTYAPEVRERVHALVSLERACCAFLHFTVEGRSDATHLRIVAPDVPPVDLDALFAPFLVGAPAEMLGATGAQACAVDCGCGAAARDSGVAGQTARVAECT
jgi:hypothetical protein